MVIYTCCAGETMAWQRDRIRKVSLMSGLEEGRARFGSFTPLSDRLEGDVRLLCIGELFGGTKAYSARNLAGAIALIAKCAKEGERPDAIILDGGLMPEIPARGSRGNRRKIRFLREGIEGMQDAAFLIRAQMKKLIKASGGIPIIYVLGEEDRENIEIIVDRLIAQGKSSEHLGRRLDALRASIADIDSRMMSIEAEMQMLKGALDDKREALASCLAGHEAELKSVRGTLKLICPRNDKALSKSIDSISGPDASATSGRRKRVLGKANEISTRILPSLKPSFASKMARRIREMQASIAKADELSARMDMLEKDVSDEARRLKGMAQKREGLLARRTRMAEQAALCEDDLSNLGAIRRTKTGFASPEEIRQIEAQARKEYADLLHRLFEGADLRLIWDNLGLADIGGLRLAIGHNVENTSKTAKNGGMASKEDAQSRLQMSGLLPGLDLFVFSHHPGTKGWAIPQSFASEHPLYLLQLGGFSDPRSLLDSHNQGIKIPQTEALFKDGTDSSATLVHAHQDGSITFTTLGEEHLAQLARPSLLSERRALLRKIESSEGDPASGGTLDPIEAERLKSELSSEMSDEKLASLKESLGGSEAVLAAMVRAPARRRIIEVVAEAHSDYHIGVGSPWDDHSAEEVMRAVIADSQALGLPDLVIFGGDMVEGALGSKPNEFIARTLIDALGFERVLDAVIESRKTMLRARMSELEGEKALLGREAFLEASSELEAQLQACESSRSCAMLEFHRRASLAYTVPNVDEQVRRLKPLLEHAAAIVEKGGEAVLISGNHFNQTHRDERMDEATRLASEISSIGGLRPNDPRIHVFYGGWQGSGQVKAKGIPLFGIHGGKGSKDKVSGLMRHLSRQRRMDAFLMAEGHYHDMAWGKDLSGAYLSIPSIAPTIPYVDQSAQHAGLRGYTRMSLFVDEKGRHFESIGVTNRYVPQLRERLEAIDPTYLEVLRMVVKKMNRS